MNRRFDVDAFKNHLRTTWLGSEFIYIEKVSSTNTCLKQIPSTEMVHGTVVNTDHQTRGRGQYERRWYAEPGENLTFTVGFRPPSADRITLLTLSSALGITLALERYLERNVSIKWPNDILVDGKKIGGILTECMFLGQKPERVLIGVGLNIGKNHFDNELIGTAVSLTDVCQKEIVREKLLAECLLQIELAYHKWHKQDTELHKQISQKMIGYGEWVHLKINDELQQGLFKFLGVNEKGELLALNEELDVNTFSHEQVRIITGS